jgi:D-aminoacyl-tRNA deacylase
LINSFTIVTSKKDPASNTMRNYLIEDEKFEITNHCFEKNQDNNNYSDGDYIVINSSKHSNTDLITTDQSLINFDDFNSIIPKDHLIIFLSKHESKSKKATLTSHSTGNFSDIVLMGGKPMEIGNTFPSFQKYYMKKLHESRNDLLNYDLTIEATHHGPTSLLNPVLFIEIGSSEDEWNNKSTASIVCKCILDTIKDISKNISNSYTDIAIGIGGNHYPQKFNDLILYSNVAFGPIISKYNLPFINERIMSQIKGKSIEKIDKAYIDKKGIGQHKEKILNTLSSQELEIAYI